ncbi:hypothetical protein A9K97_gp032 [Tokyovirus A1]|uniref:hypothetical protein n=1 Tax=Tokyovirus A1 TaxID=1826170 RepID=UPI0007A97C1B|nr:hypothetical protein A9K97_gp032 [Tokyovirus A1]BAU80319.1 hypothetical protein [Tokyovirus A1]
MSVSFFWSDDNLASLIAKYLPPRDVLSLSHTNKQNKRTFSNAFSGLLKQSWWTKGATEFWKIFGGHVSQELLEYVLEGESAFYITNILIQRVLYRTNREYFDSLVKRKVVAIVRDRIRTKDKDELYLCGHLFQNGGEEIMGELIRRGVRIERFCGDCPR